VKRFLKDTGDLQTRLELEKWLKIYQVYQYYDGILLLDRQGRARISIPSEQVTYSHNLVAQNAAALASGQITFMDFQRDTPTEAIHLAILIPIIDRQAGSQRLGTVVLQINPQTYLYPLLRRWPAPSSSAETLLVRREAGQIVYLNELRFQPDAALSLRISLMSTAVPAVRAVLGETGLVQGNDYRGVPVLADVNAVPGTTWFLVSKMDIEEVYAPLRARLWQTLALIGSAIFCAGAGLALVWRQQRIRFYRGLAESALVVHESERQLKEIQKIAGLGSYRLDFASGLWQSSEVLDGIFGIDKSYVRSVEGWLELVHPADRQAMQEYFTGQVVGQQQRFDREYRIVRVADQAERWVYGQGELQTDDQGRLTSMLGIIQDVTDRKRAEEELREAEQRFRNLFERHEAIMLLVEPDGGEIVDANAAAASFYGYRLEELRRMNLRDIQPAAEPDSPQWHAGNLISTQRCANGETRVVEIHSTLISIGGLKLLFAIIHDITDRQRIEIAEREQRALAEALRDTAAALNSSLKFEEVLDQIMDNVGRVVSHDTDAIILLLLDSAREVAHVARIRSTRDADYIAAMELMNLSVSQTRSLHDMYQTGAPDLISDTSGKVGWHPDPLAAWIRANLGAPIMIRGETIGFLNLASAKPNTFSALDAEHLRAFANQAAIAIENARLYEEVQELAITDALTGVFNRRGLFQIGEREVERANRFQHPLAVIMLDIDLFKDINDTCGHAAGDEMLCALAACCRAQLRTVDVIGRYGGDEFVLLLPETDRVSAAQVAERLRCAVEELAVRLDAVDGAAPQIVHITISQGVSLLTPDIADLTGLLARVDKALYAAKQSGRNRVAVDD
jgi:diguanylate cyclase (GGDEF)-like protein/PAS domain S-box-containing protein